MQKRVQIDATKSIIKGKKINLVARRVCWICFSYERLIYITVVVSWGMGTKSTRCGNL